MAEKYEMHAHLAGAILQDESSDGSLKRLNKRWVERTSLRTGRSRRKGETQQPGARPNLLSSGAEDAFCCYGSGSRLRYSFLGSFFRCRFLRCRFLGGYFLGGYFLGGWLLR
ncbi:MAG: hypothetical protein ACM3W8_00780, partial [Sideroxydans sp.]